MQDFQNSMETFFLNVFNSSVPAYSGDDSHTRATIVRDFMKKYPGCINDTRSNSLIDYDRIYYLAKSRNMSEESLVNEIIEAHKQAVASVAPDYYPIVDGGWLATYANLQKLGCLTSLPSKNSSLLQIGLNILVENKLFLLPEAATIIGFGVMAIYFY